jgi:hypothetical protein
VTTSARHGFHSPLPYAVWLALSAALLVVAQWIDPYVFGFTAFGVAAISALLIGIAIFHGKRSFAWACASSLPCIAAFALLSTYKWA